MYKNWFKHYPKHAVLFPNIPMDQPLTKEQEDELRDAVQKQQTVSIHILKSTEFLLISRYSEHSELVEMANECFMHKAHCQPAAVESDVGSSIRESRAQMKVEIYSEKYFAKKAKPLLNAEVATSNVHGQGEKLVAGQRICQNLLENEDKEVVAEINRIYEAGIQVECHKKSEEQEKGEKTDHNVIAA